MAHSSTGKEPNPYSISNVPVSGKLGNPLLSCHINPIPFSINTRRFLPSRKNPYLCLDIGLSTVSYGNLYVSDNRATRYNPACPMNFPSHSTWHAPYLTPYNGICRPLICLHVRQQQIQTRHKPPRKLLLHHIIFIDGYAQLRCGIQHLRQPRCIRTNQRYFMTHHLNGRKPAPPATNALRFVFHSCLCIALHFFTQSM